MKEQFINQFQISKTLGFSLIPVGKTEENFNNKLLLEEDKQRAEDYAVVKKIIDRYHQVYIDSVLSSVNCVDGLTDYVELYYQSGKDEKDTKKMEELEASMRKFIAKALTTDKRYKDLSSAKSMIEEILPEFVDEDEKDIVSRFHNFSTYFSGFFTNRKNMYSEQAQSTAVSYRCINDNLPKFLDNSRSFKRIAANIPAETLEELSNTLFETYSVRLEDAFSVDYFAFVLSQSGIDRYNGIIGGYSCSDGTKVKGLNEIINLYNQQVAKGDKSKKLPSIKPLYKQILSDRDTVSFLPEKFTSDDEVVAAVNDLYKDVIEKTLPGIKTLFENFGSYDPNGIFVSAGLAITNLSNAAFGSGSAFTSAWNRKYEETNPIKKGKSHEKYDEEMKKAFKRIRSFRVAEIQKLGSSGKTESSIGSVEEYYVTAVSEKVNFIVESYEKAEALLTSIYSEKHDKKLMKNDTAVELIKNFLDGIKDLEKTIKPLHGTGKEEEKDELFYGEFLPLYDALSTVDRLYDKVRNYVTQKPYSMDKIKLNFEIPNALNGWVDSVSDNSDNGTQYGGYIFRKLNSIGEYDYFVGISQNKKLFRFFIDVSESDKSEYQRLDYYQPKEQTIYGKAYKSECSYDEDKKKTISVIYNVASTKADPKTLEDINDYLSGNLCTAIGLMNRIKIHHPNFYDVLISDDSFSEINNYMINNLKNTLSGMSRIPGALEVANKDYYLFTDIMTKISELSKSKIYNYFSVSQNELDSALCDDDKTLFLFRISNKDLDYAEKYSEGLRKGRGTDNLHTMYLKKMLSGEQTVFDIGSGEIFYRESSIKNNERTIHPSGIPLKNKNVLNPKEKSTFDYDLIKDRRYTVDKFMIHLSMTINYSAPKITEKVFNNKVRLAIKNSASGYVIGIDRGERNLIYISVINGNGEIVEQMSLNEIISDNGYKVDYQSLLDRKEKERDKARKSWGTVENIKELKVGYLSQVVHKICELVVKYDAIIAMEGLNFGFKNGRFKVEKQVYQKFENMLISKLNYLADKKAELDSEGGILKGYQLTNKFEGTNKGRQNGIVFYVPAWLTSKIDPTTGFADLLRPKYTSAEATRNFFDKFDSIAYNKSEDVFEFSFDYSDFPKCNADFKKKWTVCTNADRILTFRNRDKNNEWDNKRVVLTDEFKRLFDEYDIDYCENLKENICKYDGKKEVEFFKKLIGNFALTLQMRNSITGSTNPDDDYLISPVRNETGGFYDSRNYRGNNAPLPTDADANGAYNIARKALWAIGVLKDTPEEEIDKANLSITDKAWLEFTQKS